MSRKASGFRCRKARLKSGEVLLKKRWLIIFAVALAAVLAFAWLGRREPPEPVYQGKTVMAWARDMNNPDLNARSNAIVALRNIGMKGIPSLVRNLERPDSILKKPWSSLTPKLPLWVRRSALRALKPFDPPIDRLAAVNGLIALGTNAPVRPLIQALRDPEGVVANQAAAALGGLGAPATPGLIRALSDNDSNVRARACYALFAMGPAASNAIPALIQRLTDTSPNIPPLAAQALGKIYVPAIAALAQALRNPDARVRAEAARALTRIGPQAREAAPALIEATKDPQGTVRACSVEALSVVRPFSPTTVAALVAVLKDENLDVRVQALAGLARADRFAATSVPALIEALDDKSPLVRGGAALVLGTLGPAAQPAIKALRKGLADGDESVRVQAQEALRKIESPAVPPPRGP